MEWREEDQEKEKGIVAVVVAVLEGSNFFNSILNISLSFSYFLFNY